MITAKKAKHISKEILIVAGVSALIYLLVPFIVDLDIRININNVFEVIAITLCLIIS